ncbi:uncharacterized protein LOC106173401 [Lingula anatina]|uniref:Uncharacterized protein LOC106173401 n=1 Tax=Lingula anatina TaxID=7574 RepID=A0A1S3JHW6_LINAN|nr:uncharacterized protein LOC106173401 [Lingula anatina]|eukprot:XP_013409982.1 uncharacterized protein LOC106173401 [Lingula anatina]
MADIIETLPGASDSEFEISDDNSDAGSVSQESTLSDGSYSESVPFISVQGYQFEPRKRERVGPLPENESVNTEAQRVGNTEWCECGHCSAMTTEAESRCCHEIPEVKNRAEEGGVDCIIMHPGFGQGCLNPYALEIAYLHHRQQYGAIPESHGANQAEKYRYIAYRQVVRWCWGYLGKHRRVPLPACAVSKIRNTFTTNGHYTGFRLPNLR